MKKVSEYISRLEITQSAGKSKIIRDFGYTVGKTRSDMVADFLANVAGRVSPDAAMLGFLSTTANDADVYTATSACGEYVFTIHYFEVAEK